MLGIDKDIVAYEEFKRLINLYNIKTIVETGTWIGNTTESLLSICDNVWSVEVNKDSFNKACERFKGNNNIKLKLLNMDSVEFLKRYMNFFLQPILFFLDAHGPPIPLLGELEVIADNKIKPIITIHDFAVPNKNFNNDGFDFKYIESSLIKIYGKDGFNYYYNQECNRQGNKPECVGIIYILPKV